MKKILLLITIISLIMLPCGCQGEEPALSLQGYPHIFDGFVSIFTEDDISFSESFYSNLIQENLCEKISFDKAFVRSSSLIENRRVLQDNIIIVLMPDSEGPIIELLDKADIQVVTSNYPGENKGIVQITRNPYNGKKVLLVVGGSNENGLDAVVRALEKANFDDVSKQEVNWEGDIPIEFPIGSRSEAIRYAILDPDVQMYIDDLLSEEYGISFGAHYNSNSQEWNVVISDRSPETEDGDMYISFLSDGTITLKRVGGDT